METNSWKSEPPYQFLSVITTLKNNTSDTIRYVSMSCSWQEAYIVDTKALSIPIECDKNIPMLAVIPPYAQEQKTLMFVTEKNREELQGVMIRVGFNWLIAKDRFEANEKFKQLRDMKNLIWSEPLELR